MRILVAVDDTALSLFLEKSLMLDGHEVSRVCDGAAAVEHVLQRRPELMVLDLELPVLHGLSVLETLQGCAEETKILVLTGNVSARERVRALNLGADDCMVKPFSMQELQARCKAIGRRRGGQNNAVLRHDDVVLDRMCRTVQRGGVLVDLTVKEFALLE